MKKLLFILVIPVLVLAFFFTHVMGAVLLIGSVGGAFWYYLRHK